MSVFDAGIHCHRYPVGDNGGAPSPAPTGLCYTSVRTHDGGVQWRDLNPAPGVYNYARMDAIAAAHLGKTIVHTVYGTPSWAVLHQSDLIYKDKWGTPGGAAAAKQSALQTHLVDFLTRYKGRIKAIEIWNEPKFAGYNPDSFFWGTAEELVQMGGAVRMAVNAVDPSVQVWSPGFDYLPAMTEWLSAGVITKGRDLIDAVAFHRYEFWQSLAQQNVITDYFGVQVIRKLMATNGIGTKKLVLSEYGIAPNFDDPRIAEFALLTSAQRRAYVTGLFAMLKGAGVSGAYLYAWDQALCGDLINDTQGPAKSFGDMVALLSP